MAIMHTEQKSLQAQLSTARMYVRYLIIVVVMLVSAIVIPVVKTAVEAAQGTGSPIAASSVPMVLFSCMLLGAALVVSVLLMRFEQGNVRKLERKLGRFGRNGMAATS